MKQVEASYTVEFALLLPVWLFVLFAPVYAGYEMYGRAEEASACGWDETFCAEDIVRKIRSATDLLEELR